MRLFSGSHLIRGLVIALSLTALGLIAGCTSGLAEPFDISNLYFEYDTVSDSDGEYIVITRHLVSQSDVKIPNSIYDIPVRKVADSVFAGDKKIQSVTFGKNVQSIGVNAFGKCPSLQSVTFNNSLAEIGDYAFLECVSLTSAALPDQIRSVGRGAFYGCTSLSEISVPPEISFIGGRAFGETAWMAANAKYEFVTVGDGVLIAYNGRRSEVRLPKNITRIAGAFAGNTNLKKITFNSGISSIGDMAFMGCSSLKTVSIPSSVTEIGNSALYGCTSLEKLDLPESVQSIGADAFTNCTASLYVKPGSYAEKYCVEYGLDYFTGN